MPFDYSICEFVLYYLCLKAVLDSNCNVNQNELSWYLVETPGNRFPNSKNRKLKSPNAGISSNWEKDGNLLKKASALLYKLHTTRKYIVFSNFQRFYQHFDCFLKIEIWTYQSIQLLNPRIKCGISWLLVAQVVLFTILTTTYHHQSQFLSLIKQSTPRRRRRFCRSMD